MANSKRRRVYTNYETFSSQMWSWSLHFSFTIKFVQFKSKKHLLGYFASHKVNKNTANAKHLKEIWHWHWYAVKFLSDHLFWSPRANIGLLNSHKQLLPEASRRTLLWWWWTWWALWLYLQGTRKHRQTSHMTFKFFQITCDVWWRLAVLVLFLDMSVDTKKPKTAVL